MTDKQKTAVTELEKLKKALTMQVFLCTVVVHKMIRATIRGGGEGGCNQIIPGLTRRCFMFGL